MIPVSVRRGRYFIAAKGVVRWWRGFHQRVKLRFKTPDSPSTLFVVHVGKSGGTFTRKILNMSPILQLQFSTVRVVHAIKAPLHKESRYLILVRDPISRSISAFNWRYSKVVLGGEPGRFPNEARVLSRYESLSNLAENLYSEGTLNRSVDRDFRSIHHLRENISFHIAWV